MISIPSIRQSENNILVFGNHHHIIQSILDFDYLSGKKKGSIVGIVTGRRGVAKYFFGRQEVLIPTFSSPNCSTGSTNFWFLNLLSGRRALTSTLDILTKSQEPRTKNLKGGALFAENVPEFHSLKIIHQLQNWSTGALEHSTASPLVLGPASVGLLVPGVLKLGPIGGITPTQITESELTVSGSLAVLSASGGMTNELINIAIGAGHHISFALSFGGDRFPVLSPRQAFLLAQEDHLTKTVLYYGELGGEDEYELIKLRQEGKFTKNVIAHIGGTVASLFKEAPQFGHAKAKADKKAETALAKRKAMREAGFQVSNSFSEFIDFVSRV